MRNGKAIIAAAILATGGASVTPAAAEQAVVVELYTSQGCSSCPPADEYLVELAARDDVIALSLHVDYWDYLGWRDAFAAPEHAKRQKWLAKLRGERMIYTPQMVVDGAVAVVGSDRAAVEAAVADALGRDHAVEARLAPEGDMLRADVAATGPVDAEIVYMIYDHPREVEIERGENRGLSVAYVNTVRALMPIGPWRQELTRLPLSYFCRKRLCTAPPGFPGALPWGKGYEPFVTCSPVGIRHGLISRCFLKPPFRSHL